MDNDTRQKLKNHILTVEQILSEMDTCRDYLKQKFAEVKHDGFDVKVFKEALKARKKDPQQKEQEETLLNVYLNAINQGETE